MSNFINALQTNDTLTENGMPAHSSSGSKLVNLFFQMGGARALTQAELQGMFANAFGEDALLATKAAFYNRDIRGGQGERESFRTFYRYLIEVAPEIAVRNIPNVVKFGRWDDLLVTAADTAIEAPALAYIVEALAKGDKLCAKWMPRENKNGYLANKIRVAAGLNWKEYRKLLAGNTDVVETKMCQKSWTEIDYNKIPSQAIHKYRKAFARNDRERYTGWITSLEKGEEGVKVNAGAIYPHQLVAPFLKYGGYYGVANVSTTEARALQVQWDALPDFMPKGRKILPICDVSGSMHGVPMEVSVALGIYLAERNEGPFKDAFITFSGQPTLFHIKSKDLKSKVAEVARAPWGMNTNLEAVFKLILKKASEASLPAEDMPETVLILSDMQFDQCVQSPKDNAYSMIQRMYESAGYKLPQIVFWNLRTSFGVPVKFNQQGTALVSGFSPSIMENLLSGKDMTPLAVVLNKLNSPRYESVTL